jgi:hypothetical protein
MPKDAKKGRFGKTKALLQSRQLKKRPQRKRRRRRKSKLSLVD